MKAIEMWSLFIIENPSFEKVEYDVWCFGGGDESADTLAKLVFEKTKTSTTSAFELYEDENEPIPKVGCIDIVLDSKENAICIIETTKVYVTKFNQVTKEHAYLEGEGDRSLEYWRRVHETFFIEELKTIDKEFYDDMPVVCEEFKVIYS